MNPVTTLNILVVLYHLSQGKILLKIAKTAGDLMRAQKLAERLPVDVTKLEIDRQSHTLARNY